MTAIGFARKNRPLRPQVPRITATKSLSARSVSQKGRRSVIWRGKPVRGWVGAGFLIRREQRALRPALIAKRQSRQRRDEGRTGSVDGVCFIGRMGKFSHRPLPADRAGDRKRV